MAHPAPLIGRRAEWAVALGELDQLTAGRPTWLAVDGEPGIGKSRLLAELSRVADERRCLVLTGRGSEFEQSIPFGMWVDALDDYLGALGPARLGRLIGGVDPELGAVFPAVAGWTPSGPSARSGERSTLRRAVRALLGTLAAARPVLLVLDDVQWADPASIDLLAHLLRRPPAGPLLVAVACRPGGLEPQGVLGGLQAAVRNVGGSWLTLDPMTRAESGELLAAEGLPPRLRDAVFADSGGNPFYLQQLARVAQRPAGASRGHDSLPGVPPGVAAALGQELDALSRAARLLAQGAAIAGEPFDAELAAMVAGLPDHGFPEPLDELLGAGLLHPTDVPRRYRFRHPIVRRAVYHSAAPGWRADAHGRAAAMLADLAPAARAHHVELSARPGDLDAVAVLVEAAELAARSAPAAAIQWYGAALRLLPAGSAQRRLELTVALGLLLVGAGELAPGRDRLVEALAMDPPDAVRVDVATACAAAENMLGDNDSARQRLLGALGDLADDRSAPAARVRLQLATDALHRTERAEAHRWASAAAMIAGELGDPPLAAQATALVALLTCWLDPPGADAVVVAAAARLDSLSGDDLAGRLDVPYFLGHAELHRERYEDARRHLQRGVDLSRATGQAQFLVPMLTGLAFVLDALGELAEAAVIAQQAVELAEKAEVPFQASWALAFRSWIASGAGDLATATACAAAAIERLTSTDPAILRAAVHALVAATWLAADQPDRCVAALASAGAPEFPLVDPGHRCAVYATLAGAELARGDSGAARQWVERGERLSAELDLPIARAAVLRAKAEVLLRDGSPAAAVNLALLAVAAALSGGARVPAALGRLLAGRALAAAGEVERAIGELRTAEATLGAVGARRGRDEAAAELRRLSRAPVGDGLVALSPREQQIAWLVAQGNTNRRLAATLFISEKTVEASLTRIYGKLGVTSRAALAAAVGRGDAGGR